MPRRRPAAGKKRAAGGGGGPSGAPAPAPAAAALSEDPVALVQALRRQVQDSLRAAEGGGEAAPAALGQLPQFPAPRLPEPEPEREPELQLQPEREPEPEPERELQPDPEPERQPEPELQPEPEPEREREREQEPEPEPEPELQPEPEPEPDAGSDGSDDSERSWCSSGGGAPAADEGEAWGTVFDKLCDSRLFTGHHKYQHVDELQHSFAPELNPVSEELVTRARRDESQGSRRMLDRFDDWESDRHHNRHAKLREVVHDETAGRHFSPEVNPASEVLAVKVRGSALSHREIVRRLVRVDQEKEEWLQIKREEQAESQSDHTFRPRINEKSKRIVGEQKAAKGNTGTTKRGNVYDRLSSPKHRTAQKTPAKAPAEAGSSGSAVSLRVHDGQRCAVISWHSHVPARDSWLPFQTKIEGEAAWSTLPEDVVQDDEPLSERDQQAKLMKMRQHQREYQAFRPAVHHNPPGASRRTRERRRPQASPPPPPRKKKGKQKKRPAPPEKRTQKKREETTADVIYVDCPAGVGPGDLLAVNTPSGETVEVVVPDDVAAGDQFEILLAVNAPSGEIVESAAPSEAREERPVADEDASAGQRGESVAQQSDDAATQSTKADRGAGSTAAPDDDAQKMHLLTLADAPKTKATKEPTSVAGPPRTTTVSMSALGAPKTGSGVAPSATTTPGRLPVEMEADPDHGRDFVLMIEENACCRARAKLKCRAATLDALIHHVTNRVNPSVSGPYALSMAGGVTPTQITRIEDVPGKAKVQLWQVSRFTAPGSGRLVEGAVDAAPGGAAKVRLSKRPPPPKR
eukprot:COSAG04_NODE_295_length_17731_cov_1811.367287_6_plen_805_part_00